MKTFKCGVLMRWRTKKFFSGCVSWPVGLCLFFLMEVTQKFGNSRWEKCAGITVALFSKPVILLTCLVMQDS